MNDEIYYWAAGEKRPIDELRVVLDNRREAGARIVTTNGCFDLLHSGHVAFLETARSHGDVLVVCLNGDRSVTALKGPGRPIVPEADRAALLGALRSVDYVAGFDGLLPNSVLSAIRPHVHCKAADYSADSLPEASVVRFFGGDIEILPLVEGFSTSRLIGNIVSSAQGHNVHTAESTHSGNDAEALSELLGVTNALRQTAYGVAGRVSEVVSRVKQAVDTGRRVLVIDLDSQRDEDDSTELCTSPLLHTGLQRPVLRRGSPEAGTKSPTQVDSGDVLFIVMAEESPIAVKAAQAAQKSGAYVISLTGDHCCRIPEVADMVLSVPSSCRAHIRSAHTAVLEIISEMSARCHT